MNTHWLTIIGSILAFVLQSTQSFAFAQTFNNSISATENGQSTEQPEKTGFFNETDSTRKSANDHISSLTEMQSPPVSNAVEPSLPFNDFFAFKELQSFGKEIAKQEHWNSLGRVIVDNTLGNIPAALIAVFAGLFFFVCFCKSRMFSDRIVKLAIQDNFISSLDTFKLFVSQVFVSILAWSFLLVFGLVLLRAGGKSPTSDFLTGSGWGSIALFLVLATYRLLKEFLSNGGVAEAIYGVKYSTARYILNQIDLAFVTSAPLAFLFVFLLHFSGGRWYPSLGALVFIATLITVFVQFQKIFAPGSRFYKRLESDDNLSHSKWLANRHFIYWIGVAVILLTLALSIVGSFDLALAISIRAALTTIVASIVLAFKTIVDRRASEYVRRKLLVQELGQSADSTETLHSVRVQQFVEKNSQMAKQSVASISVLVFLGTTCWIWSDMVSLPKDLFHWDLSGVTTIAQVFIIALVTVFAARRLPGLIIWTLAPTKVVVPNSRLIAQLMSVGIVCVGVILACNTASISVPVISWLGTAILFGAIFAGRTLIADFVAGLMTLFSPRIQEGDCVNINGDCGRVEQVNIFSTVIQDNLGNRITIPNHKIVSESVVKLRDEATLPMLIEIGVSRDSDTHQAHALMILVVERDKQVIQDPRPEIRFIGFRGEDFVFQIRLLVSTLSDFNSTKQRVREQIVLEFERHGITHIEPQDSSPSTFKVFSGSQSKAA